jgi:hypothetical protein
MPLNINRKLTNVELAHKYWSASQEANNYFERWLMYETDALWEMYLYRRQVAEIIRTTINTRDVEAA